MKKLMMTVLGMAVAVSVAVAGNIDSPGLPSAGSGMYTLQGLYDYLISGTALSVAGSFQEPTAGPASTGKTTKQIGDDIKTLFDQCDATADDVASGKKFFSTASGNWGVKTGTASGGGGGLLQTGQTTSYVTGDDGYYEKGAAFSYTDNGDGTVTDDVTSLMWAKDPSGAGGASGSAMVWSNAVAWAEGLSFAGYTDWRLPNVTELATTCYQGTTYAPWYINTTIFGSGYEFYWSSTTNPRFDGYAYAARYGLDASFMDRFGKTAGGVNARAVRGGN